MDDALFLGDGNEQNIINLVKILRCFFMVSGLRINLIKSNLFGIGVSEEVVSNLAAFTGCSAGSFPFSYLGIPIGESMKCVKG